MTIEVGQFEDRVLHGPTCVYRLHALVRHNITVEEIGSPDLIEIDMVVGKVQDTKIVSLLRKIRRAIAVNVPSEIVSLPSEESV